VSALHGAQEPSHIGAAGARGHTARIRKTPVSLMEGDLRMIRLALTFVLSAALPLAATAKPMAAPEPPAWMLKPVGITAPDGAPVTAAKKEPGVPVPLTPVRMTGGAWPGDGKAPGKPDAIQAKH
jgi:hypothetical protein